MDRLENKGYSYIIYDYIKEDNKFTAIYHYDNQEKMSKKIENCIEKMVIKIVKCKYNNN